MITDYKLQNLKLFDHLNLAKASSEIFERRITRPISAYLTNPSTRKFKLSHCLTRHRRPSRVLIDAAEYDRLKALDLRRAYYAEELGEDVLTSLQAADFDHPDPTLDKLMD